MNTRACLVVSFRALLLSVAAMLAEPVPNKQFYSIRPGRQRPATARCADKAATSRGDPAMTSGTRRAGDLSSAVRCQPTLNQAMHESRD